MKNNKILREAINYKTFGLSVIPTRGKIPCVNWQEYQINQADEKLLTQWFTKDYPGANIAVVTGKISGIVVVDVDKGGDVSQFPQTIMSKTGNDGYHLYYKYPNQPVKSVQRILPNVDIRGDGGIAILPPSIHQNGKHYEWKVSFEMAELEEYPQFLLEKQKQTAIKPTDWHTLTSELHEEGTRTDATVKMVGKLLHHIPINEWESVALPLITTWNESTNLPPLPENEMETICKSIAAKEITSQEGTTQENKKFEPHHISTILDKEYGNTTWLIEKLAPLDGIVAISGHPSNGKTWVLLQLMLSVASGEKLFGKFTTKKTGVLLIDEENGERVLQDRFNKLHAHKSLPVFCGSLNGFKLTESSVNDLIDFCSNNKVGFVLFDSLVRIHTSEENDATQMAKVNGFLKRFCQEGITVAFSHHNRKPGPYKLNPAFSMHGSSDILANVDSHISIIKIDDVIEITQTKLRQEKLLNPFKVKCIIDEKTCQMEFDGDIDEMKTKRNACKDAVLEELQESEELINKSGLKNALIIKGLTFGPTTFNDAISELLNEEQIFSKKGTGNSTLYSLTPFTEEKEEENE